MEQEELIEFEYKINCIFDFADGRENFSTDFVESLQSQLLTKKFLTDRQKNSINNIIEKWEIEI